jgi:LexA-binding, inner membrane-associated putative hydrolase
MISGFVPPAVDTVTGMAVSRETVDESVARKSTTLRSGDGDHPRMRPATSSRLELSGRTVLLSLATIAIADLVIWRWKAPYAAEALFDEAAHVATGLLALAAVGVSFPASVVFAVLGGSLLIDLDHLPHLFGSHFLEHGTPRPYTHMVGTVAFLFALALVIRERRWRLLVGVAGLALALHFFRDVAEPGGPGVSLLWPFSDHAFSIPYQWYAGVLAAFAALALARRKLRLG